MADANPITLPPPHKGLTRRSLLGALPLAGASLTLSFPMGVDSDFPAIFDEDGDPPHPVLALPFVREATEAERGNGATRCFWSVMPTGAYRADCETGGRLAEAALDYMVGQNAPYLLQWAVFDMMQLRRAPTGLEIGFLSAFGRIATEAHAAQLAHGEGDLA